MKKYFLIGILMAIVPNICFGASARFTQLAREKERKMAELEKCMGSTKGLKIAGISTLGLSAVGVAANVVEAKKIKDYDSSIESTQQQIEKTQTEIEKKKAELSKSQTETQQTPNKSIKSQESIVGTAKTHDGACWENTGGTNWTKTDNCGNFSNGNWMAEFSDDTYIQGTSRCASNSGNLLAGAVGIPTGHGNYCWCQMTSSDNLSVPDNPAWVLGTYGSNPPPANCDSYCAKNCAYAAMDAPHFRAALGQKAPESDKQPDTQNKNNGAKDANTTPQTEENNSGSGSGSNNSGKNDNSTGSNENGSKGSKSTTKESPTSTSNQTLLKTQCEGRGGTWDPTRHNAENDTIHGVCVLPEMVVSTSAPSGAPKVTDPQKMLQNVITQDIAAIKNTPGKLGDKIYIHGYTISNIQHLSLHNNLYDAIEEFKNRCYDNAGDPDNAYSVIVGIDEDALGNDSDEKYTENTVLPNLQQHIVSRCECNDYDWERQGNKCVKK